jgi:hypothetical protein
MIEENEAGVRLRLGSAEIPVVPRLEHFGHQPEIAPGCWDSGGDPRDCCRRSARASWALASLVTMAETKAPATPVWERRVLERSSRVICLFRAQGGPVLWLKDEGAATESTRAKACHGEAGYDVQAEAR